MKHSRISALALTAGLIAGSTLLVAGPAQGADFYLDDSELTATETSPYPAGWFQGTVTPPAGTATSTLAGLEVSGGDYQLLNGTPVATSLTDVRSSIDLVSANDTASFQIPVFTGPGGTDYTTLYADKAGIDANLWYTSQPFGVYAAGDTATLEDFEAAMAPDYEILAFGLMVLGTDPDTIVSLSWNGDTYWFLPAPTVALSPATISRTDSSTAGKGLTLTVTGYVPGETVAFGIGNGGSGGSVGTAVADVNGAATLTYVAPSPMEIGDYTFGAFGEDSGVGQFAAFAVVADTLAATGADPTPALTVGGVLLLGGAVFLLARRRAVTTL
jgi:LPXTG-motif cell wall-anchored protein